MAERFERLQCLDRMRQSLQRGCGDDEIIGRGARDAQWVSYGDMTGRIEAIKDTDALLEIPAMAFLIDRA